MQAPCLEKGKKKKKRKNMLLKKVSTLRMACHVYSQNISSINSESVALKCV